MNSGSGGKLIGIDLFAGAGGMSVGAANAGISVGLAVELDKFAAQTYSNNHPATNIHNGDIRELSRHRLKAWRKHKHNLVVFGGPPCQGFSWSNARTRNTQNKNNWLFTEFLRVIKELSPAWVVFENVQGIVDTAAGIFIEQITNTLDGLGYSVHAAKLNAMDYGVPQNRTRFFIVASRDKQRFRFPDSLAVRHTVADAIRDLPSLGNGGNSCWRAYGRAKPSMYAESLRTTVGGCNNHLVTRNAPFVISRYKYVPQGGNWEDIPARLMKNYTDRSRCHTGIYHRLKLTEPSIVIGNFRKNMLIHPIQDRGLSVREAARIQSFPDSFKFSGSIGFQQQQVGNAVPPLLAQAVFGSIVQTTGTNAICPSLLNPSH